MSASINSDAQISTTKDYFRLKSLSIDLIGKRIYVYTFLCFFFLSHTL